ncbi:MAG: hypothetical protein KAS66_08160 [Candidatus Omnitrophica bacterium]|nr:hypothetical protein [Candidatus Omnitrophota bacterium]
MVYKNNKIVPVDRYKARVTVNRLMMEVLGEDGKPIVQTKHDTFGHEYPVTVEQLYSKGDIIHLPMDVIEKKKSSLELVMEPVKIAPVPILVTDENTIPEKKAVPDKNPVDPVSEKGIKEPTVADMIPKEDNLDTDNPKDDNPKGTGVSKDSKKKSGE